MDPGKRQPLTNSKRQEWRSANNSVCPAKKWPDCPHWMTWGEGEFEGTNCPVHYGSQVGSSMYMWIRPFNWNQIIFIIQFLSCSCYTSSHPYVAKGYHRRQQAQIQGKAATAESPTEQGCLPRCLHDLSPWPHEEYEIKSSRDTTFLGYWHPSPPSEFLAEVYICCPINSTPLGAGIQMALGRRKGFHWGTQLKRYILQISKGMKHVFEVPVLQTCQEIWVRPGKRKCSLGMDEPVPLFFSHCLSEESAGCEGCEVYVEPQGKC